MLDDIIEKEDIERNTTMFFLAKITEDYLKIPENRTDQPQYNNYIDFYDNYLQKQLKS